MFKRVSFSIFIINRKANKDMHNILNTKTGCQYLINGISIFTGNRCILLLHFICIVFL